jgi:threonine/homoserine/homoserine lactone efflux protein
VSALHVAWFAAALALAAAIPGPAVMATIGRVLAHGTRGALAFYLGLVLGDLLWLWSATLGLGAAAGLVGPLLRWVECAGAAYLLMMAWTMWTTPPVAPATAPPATRDRRAVLSGFLLQLGNPKAVLFYAALVPALMPIGSLNGARLVVLSIVVAVVLFAINLGYVRSAELARRYVRSPRALRAIYRTNAVVLTIAAAAAVISAWGASP